MPLASCATEIDPQNLATGALEAIPAAAIALAAGNRVPTGSPMEVYSRIARGAHGCWLGGPGGLRKTHDFHAVSQPLRDGGQSKIIIYLRPSKSAPPEQKGTQAFRVRIAPQGTSASVEAENLKMPPELGNRMIADTHRWAAGEEGCIDGGVKEGWETVTPEEPPTKAKLRKTSRKK